MTVEEMVETEIRLVGNIVSEPTIRQILESYYSRYVTSPHMAYMLADEYIEKLKELAGVK